MNILPTERVVLRVPTTQAGRLRELSVSCSTPENIGIEFVRIDNKSLFRGVFVVASLPLKQVGQTERALYLSSATSEHGRLSVGIRNLSGHVQHFLAKIRIQNLDGKQIEIELGTTT